MRFLFATFAWPSHYYPMVPLAWALRAAGHEVRVASPPSLVDTIVTTGLPAVAVGKDVDIADRARNGRLGEVDADERWPADRNDWSDAQRALVRRMALTMYEVADAMVDDLVTYARSWRPDLVVHESVTFAGAVAAEVLGVPSAAHGTGMPIIPGMLVPRDNPPPLPEFVDLFRGYGVAPRPVPSVWIDPCPPSIRKSGTISAPRLSVRYVPYNGPGAVPEWLVEPPERPRVCVTWGTSAVHLGTGAVTDLLSRTIEAVTGLGVDVVLTLSAATRAALGALPDGVRVADSLPLHVLLPTCRAVVHQGGVGTALTAAVHGVPQLSVTRLPDQTAVGDAFAAGGAARHLVQSETTVERIRDHVVALLDDGECRVAAERLRSEITSQPAPADLVPELVTLATSSTVHGGDGGPETS
ncbi:nucleotide disphospho-sugar-binding domain-containing protein [Micromonospora sp. NBS 11-29]|uniref:nucleotide disphospho-sugar-binding domain-containing protein n=1 Tax=Micromonospora sp. NBS 11-29 TaxID=1960879 RepID=UPI000B772EA0|nr:nucleotide disphospho-sugar-binding domain-containing protein [Micromonospora sp. NBS 11-29]